jgi:hypothetical protein
MYETGQEKEHQTYLVDPALAISMALAEAEILRLQLDIALANVAPLEEEEAPLHDLSPLGR